MSVKEKALNLGLTQSNIYELYYQMDYEFRIEEVRDFIAETYPNESYSEQDIQSITRLYEERRKSYEADAWIKILSEVLKDFRDFEVCVCQK